MKQIRLYFKKLESKEVNRIIGLFVFFLLIVLPLMTLLMYLVTSSILSPDTNFSLDYNTLYSMREVYGETGRNLYVILRWTFDIIWPFVYVIFFLTVLSLFEERFPFNKHLYSSVILIVVLDLIENVLATIFMLVYPNTVDLLLLFLMIATTLKWIMIALLSIVLLREWTIKIKENINKRKNIN